MRKYKRNEELSVSEIRDEHNPPEFNLGMNDLWFDTMIDRRFNFFVWNEGGVGEGVGLLLLGPFVEKDEMWLDCPGIRLRNGWDDGRRLALKPEKIQLENGESTYRVYFPDFVFPQGVHISDPLRCPRGRRRKIKGLDENIKKSIEVSFVLRGNPECQKKGKIAVYPMDNPKGILEFPIDGKFIFPFDSPPKFPLI